MCRGSRCVGYNRRVKTGVKGSRRRGERPGGGGGGGYDPEPGHLLQDVIGDVVKLQKQGLALCLYELSSCHLIGRLAGQLSPARLIPPCLHHHLHSFLSKQTSD